MADTSGGARSPIGFGPTQVLLEEGLECIAQSGDEARREGLGEDDAAAAFPQLLREYPGDVMQPS